MALRLTKKIFQIYRDYKHDQVVFVRYLLQVARDDRLTDDQRRTGVLPLQKVLGLVQQVVENKAIERIPARPADALLKVVKNRAASARWHEKRNALDEGHRYVLQIFSQALDLLWGKLPPIVNADSITIDQPDSQLDDMIPDLEELTLNQALSVEAFDENGNILVESKTSLLTDSEEPSVLTYTLMEEVEATEAFLTDLWAACVLAAESIFVAAAVTNQAIDMIRDLEMNLNQQLTRNNTVTVLPLQMNTRKLHDATAGTKWTSLLDPYLRMQFLLYSARDSSFDGQTFVNALRTNRNEDYFDQDVPQQILSDARHIKVQWENYKRGHGGVLHPGYPQAESIRYLGWLSQLPGVEDMADIPVCVVFAFRVSTIAQRIISSTKYFRKAQEQLEIRAECTRTSLESMKKTGGSSAVQFQNSLVGAQEVSVLRDAATIGCQNLLSELPAKSFWSGWGDRDSRKIMLWPVQSFDMRLKASNLLALVTLETGLCGALANLFLKCQSFNTVTVEWPDLEFLEDHIPEKHVFRGNRITEWSPAEFFDIMRYKFGLRHVTDKGEQVSVMQVSTRMKAARNAYEPMWDLWPVASLCKARIMNNDIMRDSSSQQLKLLLRGTAVQKFIGEKEVNVKWLRDDAGKLVFENHADLVKFADRSEELGTVQTLSLLHRALEKEVSLSNFDFVGHYKGLILLSIKLGQHWQKKGYDDVCLQEGKQYSATEYARDVVLNLCQAIQVSCEPKATEEQKLRADNMLQAAGSIIEEFVTKSGSTGIKGLQKFTSETKPLSELRPSILTRLEQNHQKYGMMEGMFSNRQLNDALWTTEVTKLEDVLREMYGESKENDIQN